MCTVYLPRPSLTLISAQAPLETLRDIGLHAEHLIGRDDFQIFLDGGVRRGTDVLKAVALGANAVGLGRPFIYAATCWGPEGVEKAIHRKAYLHYRLAADIAKFYAERWRFLCACWAYAISRSSRRVTWISPSCSTRGSLGSHHAFDLLPLD